MEIKSEEKIFVTDYLIAKFSGQEFETNIKFFSQDVYRQ